MKLDLPQDGNNACMPWWSSGNFGKSDAEVVSTALEPLQRRYDAKKAAPREALEEGERSAIAEDYSLMSSS